MLPERIQSLAAGTASGYGQPVAGRKLLQQGAGYEKLLLKDKSLPGTVLRSKSIGLLEQLLPQVYLLEYLLYYY